MSGESPAVGLASALSQSCAQIVARYPEADWGQLRYLIQEALCEYDTQFLLAFGCQDAPGSNEDDYKHRARFVASVVAAKFGPEEAG